MVYPTGSESDERRRILQAVERLSVSQVLHGSETLCRLLRFLSTQAWDHQGQPINEHEIATLLLGRGDDFDSRVDPVVRVQIGRLRAKLVEYYATEGASDELLIEIQKGSYAPTYTLRHHTDSARGRAVIQRVQTVVAVAIVILAGITTHGTQASVEFVCDPRHVREIQARLPAQRGSAFCAVLEIEVKGGVPFSSKLEAVSPSQRSKPQSR